MLLLALGCTATDDIYIERTSQQGPQRDLTMLLAELDANGERVTYDADVDLLAALRTTGREHPHDTIVLIQPDHDYTTEEVDALTRFIHAGFQVTLFTSSGRHVQDLLDEFGVTVGRAVRDDEHHYLQADYPLVDAMGDAAGGVDSAVLVDGVTVTGGEDAEVLLRSRSERTSMAVRVERGGGALVVVGAPWLIDAHDTAAEQPYTGFYLYDNCQLSLNLIGGGICTADETSPDIEEVRLLGGASAQPIASLTDANGALTLSFLTQDDRGVFATGYRIDSGEWVDVFAFNNHLTDQAPQTMRTDTSERLYIRDFPEGDSLIEVRAADQSGNEARALHAITRTLFPPASGGRIRLSGVAADFCGLVGWDAGHDVPESLSDSYYSTTRGRCETGSPGQAPYSLATADMSPGGDKHYLAGAQASYVEAGFAALRSIVGDEDLADITVHFGELSLGEDSVGDIDAGADWDVERTTETRVYSNPADTDQDGTCEEEDGCSQLELRYGRLPMLVGTMTALTLELGYGDPADCSDDYTSGWTGTITDLRYHEDAEGTPRTIGEAILADVGEDGVCFRLISDASIVQDTDLLEMKHATLEIGSCAPEQ